MVAEQKDVEYGKRKEVTINDKFSYIFLLIDCQVAVNFRRSREPLKETVKWLRDWHAKGKIPTNTSYLKYSQLE